MHPDLILDLHRLRVQESQHGAAHRLHHQRQRRPRSPWRLRRDLAALLVYLADRLADEPAVNLPPAVGGENARAAR